MYIKKLEISGFKSFVDRTVVHFDHDVIGIVGPNGCGKSNIVDAIRWCMGEQSAKHLRGASMSDVIFNGSESRAASGMAEVTLTFDNTDAEYAQSLPPEFKDYPELAVTRRLFRDGTSEYLINKTQVRLKDITELFLGTGAGTKAYSIVEQGRIGQIVSARPEDRRRFIEEAAGITKYKARRKESERKMEQTRQNLVRINDIVTELERARGGLKRQVAKAERFLEYRAELERLALHQASHKLLELTVLQRVSSGTHAEASAQAEQARQSLAEEEAAHEAHRDVALETEAAADQASREAFEADNLVSGLQASLERSRERLTHLQERLASGEAELAAGDERQAVLQAELAGLRRSLEALTEEAAQRDADVEQEGAALAELQRVLAGAEAQQREERAQVSDGQRKIAGTSARIDALTQRIGEVGARTEQLRELLERLDATWLELTARRTQLERSVQDLAEGKLLTLAERAQLEQELELLRAQQLESERAVDAAKNELGLKRSRLRALEELHRRLEGVGVGTKALLQHSPERVLGMVADRLEPPEHLTQAFAGLLGHQLQTVVVESPEQGLELLEELRRTERGRATLLPRAARFVAGPRRRGGPLPEGATRLADALSYAPEDAGLVAVLIGEAVVVPDARCALEWVQAHPEQTAVSLDGTVFHADGRVSGGKGDELAASMLEHKREIRLLTEEVERLTAKTAQLVAEHGARGARVSELSTALEQARQHAHQGELAHKTAELELARTIAEQGHVLQRRDQALKDSGELASTLELATSDRALRQAELEQLEAELERRLSLQQRADAALEEQREQVASQAALLTERRVRLAQVSEQLSAQHTSEQRLTQSLEELVLRQARLREELLEHSVSFGHTAAAMMLDREARAEAARVARARHRALDEARDRLEKLRRVLGVRDVELRSLRETLGGLDEAVRKAELALQRLELERSHLLESVRQRFRGLHLPSVVGDYHRLPPPAPDQQQRIDELSQLIDRMGPVNLDAQAELEQAEARYHSLNDQKLDVEKALQELELAIKHMDRESKKLFRETFDTVNALFKETFSKMFRGGRAELKLTDPEDLLATGVDIIAQPPGKNLGNIELMSGGEKALTAVSLIFAIFQHRPSPFCVLDEVDAPLDEANVARYNDAIRAMTDRSQFILITHIKKTMQMVDALYGVTMGEPGVSRLVGVRVSETNTARGAAAPRPGVKDAPGAERASDGSTAVA